MFPFPPPVVFLKFCFFCSSFLLSVFSFLCVLSGLFFPSNSLCSDVSLQGLYLFSIVFFNVCLSKQFSNLMEPA